MVATTFLRARHACAAALGCSVVLFGIDDLLGQASASGLQQEHALFGKCTQEDVAVAREGVDGVPAFLSDHRLEKMASSGTCRRALQLSESALANELNETPESTAEFKTQSITRKSSDKEIVARVKELLSDERSKGKERRHEAIRALDQYVHDALKESTVFAFGLGPELIPLSKIASNVIAIEGNRRKCEEFLKSDEGACAIKDNVHIYCIRPETAGSSGGGERGSDEAEGGAESLLQVSEEFGASGGGSGGRSALAAYGNFAKDLIHQQFGGVPLRTVVVLGTSAVAKLLLVLPYVDEATILISRSRMTRAAQGVLNEFLTFRIGNVESTYHEDTNSAESIFTMLRRSGPPVNPDIWANYATVEWELADSEEPFKLLKEAFEKASRAAGSENAELLRTYKRLYVRALKDASDAEWKTIMASLKKMKSMAEGAEEADAIIAGPKAFVEEYAAGRIRGAQLGAYLDLMQETAERLESSEKDLIRARILELLSGAAEITTATEMFETFKDAVEDACELAEAKPATFLPALRLISGALVSLTGLQEVILLLAAGKRIDIFGNANAAS